MKPKVNRTFLMLIGSLFVSLLIFSSCGKQVKETRSQKGVMDTPQYHVQRGDDALLATQYEQARSSYRKALSLDAEYGPALSGMAAASAYAASRPSVSSSTKKQVLEKSEAQIEKALENTKSSDKTNLSRTHNFAIQVYLALKLPADKWYEKAKDHFEEASDLTPNDPAPYFFMARAEAGQFNYENAVKLYHKVLGMTGKYEAEANKELERIQKIQRAEPGSRFGRKIANIEKITRADVAALFVAELRLDRLYEDQSQKKKTSGYTAPKSQQKLKRTPLQKYPETVDIAGHPLEETIKQVIKLDIKGLGPDPSHKFYPDQEFKRAEFAQLIQDLLIRVTHNPSLATQYIGDPSPFPDVNADVWYYNAARIVVNRGLMQVNNKVTGEFEPAAAVSGADALLAIRNMKEILKKYLR